MRGSFVISTLTGNQAPLGGALINYGTVNVLNALGESFGLEPGADCEGRMVEALRRIGFHQVLDTTFAADMTVVEEANELMQRLDGKDSSKPALPQFTSCCPAWVSFAETFYPALLPHLSTTKSPVMIQGAAIKTWYAKKNGIDPKSIVNVACTPCTAKKYEVLRPEMNASGRYLIRKTRSRRFAAASTIRTFRQSTRNFSASRSARCRMNYFIRVIGGRETVEGD